MRRRLAGPVRTEAHRRPAPVVDEPGEQLVRALAARPQAEARYHPLGARRAEPPPVEPAISAGRPSRAGIPRESAALSVAPAARKAAAQASKAAQTRVARAQEARTQAERPAWEEVAVPQVAAALQAHLAGPAARTLRARAGRPRAAPRPVIAPPPRVRPATSCQLVIRSPKAAARRRWAATGWSSSARQ
jgi:hypothetical protein